jgi:transcriptional regulator with XRE-family HTH domain
LQKYERGTNRVAASRLAAIAAALDVSPGYFFVTGAPDQTESGPQVLDCLAAAQAASQAASDLVRVAREGTSLSAGLVLARPVEAARVVAELESRPQDYELWAAIHRWKNAEHA